MGVFRFVNLIAEIAVEFRFISTQVTSKTIIIIIFLFNFTSVLFTLIF